MSKRGQNDDRLEMESMTDKMGTKRCETLRKWVVNVMEPIVGNCLFNFKKKYKKRNR